MKIVAIIQARMGSKSAFLAKCCWTWKVLAFGLGFCARKACHDDRGKSLSQIQRWRGDDVIVRCKRLATNVFRGDERMTS